LPLEGEAADAGHLATPEAGVGDLRMQLQDAIRERDAARSELVASRQREMAASSDRLNHVRNVVAIIRSIFARTMASHGSIEDVANHFRGRLDVLARYQPDIAFRPEQPFDVEDMVRDELLVVHADDDVRVTIAGPAVALAGRKAQALAFALHELTTNSIKFGVLGESAANGRVAIEWRRTVDRLILTWREFGIAIVAAAPLRQGFGREYIEHSLPYEADAETSFEMAPGRITCVIDLPLDTVK
jgi:two-component system CheB/CheR fusion protein